MSKHTRKPRHEAVRSFDTSIREHQAWALVRVGQTTAGAGTHRKES